ncbi:MAG TPA: glycosyltransferase family 39 protein [Candidatus Hydrogenedentes bacterium]|nr:glycosyltransferase family 39 protein [Candidatus Hydrogenedentota bacterium]
MSPDSQSRSVFSHDFALLGGLAALKLGLHLYFCNYYGYQRDELYFIACGEHLDWGYVDIGPLVPWLGRLMRELLGESLFAIRLPSAIAGATTVFLVGWLARYLGGGRWAQALAALSVIIAPVWLQSGNILALPSFEPLFWTSCACLIAVIFKTGNTRLWLAVGAAAGVGLVNKPSMVFFGFGLVVGLLLTRQRKHLLDKWLWLGGALALIIILPNLVWQARHDWPTWEFVYGMNRDLMSRIPRALFVVGQVFYQHPFNVLLWLAGLAWFLLAKNAEPYHAFGWLFLTVFLLLLVAKSKIYYLAPAFPMLLAAGAVAIQDVLERRALHWPKAAIPAVLLLGGLLTVPVALPVLSIDRVDNYVRAATFGALDNIYEVTGTWHDQFGWENQAATVAQVFERLTPEEQADCLIIVSNFGQAGAIDMFGPAYGLPRATCVHQNYFFWGPGPGSGQIAVAYGIGADFLGLLYEEVETAGRITCEQTVRYENNLPVYLCRGPKISLHDAWKEFRIIAFSNTGIPFQTAARLMQSLAAYQ